MIPFQISPWSAGTRQPKERTGVMNLTVLILTLAVAANGLLAGLNLDTALVKLPARKRIGVVAYTAFARGNDLGNGLVVYPLLGIGAALLTVIATVFAFVEQRPTTLMLSLFFASLLSLLHSVATTRAAPVMLSLKKAPDDEAILAAKLDRFARWHAVWTTVQILTFFVLLWAMVVA
jgi:hypothetical protein